MQMETAHLSRASPGSLEQFQNNFRTASRKHSPIVVCVYIQWFLDLLCWRVDDGRGVTCGNCIYRRELFISQTWCALECEIQFCVFREKVEKMCAVTAYLRPLLFSYIPFRIICGYLSIQGKITQNAWEEVGVYGGNTEVATIICIYNVSVSICFVLEGQFTQPQVMSCVKLWLRELYLC
jgi:hypothetical protein